MNTPHPLAQGNRFQRAYYRWAEPHYRRIGADDPELRRHIEEVDVLLYTRKGLGGWAGWLLGALGCGLGLHAAGMPLLSALGLAFVVQLGLSFALLSVWLGARQKPKSQTMSPTRRIVLLLPFVVVPGMAGALFGAWMKHGGLSVQQALDLLTRLLPGFAFTLLGMLILVVGVWQASRKSYERRLEHSRLQQERDAAKAQALEADLRLLQAQIHPHFVFNTLATLQHWVDRRDERAGPLLRELTGFLRRSTEMLGRATVPLAEEVRAVRHYLAILDARLEGRVRGEVHVPDGLAARTVPPGLLLTLVENAVEHGLEPKIGPGRLELAAGEEPDGRWWLRVDDDGLGLADDAGDDVGLTNLRQRLQHHFGERARFTLQRRAEGGTRAEIQVFP